MTVTFDPILMDNSFFKKFITDPGNLLYYAPLFGATIQNIRFFNREGYIQSSVTYAFKTYEKALEMKKALKDRTISTPSWRNIQIERNLLIIEYRSF